MTLLIEFKDHESKEQVMSNLKYLKDAEAPYKGISVAHDIWPLGNVMKLKQIVQLAKKEHSRIEADPAENYWFRVVGMETKMRIVKVRKQ